MRLVYKYLIRILSLNFFTNNLYLNYNYRQLNLNIYYEIS